MKITIKPLAIFVAGIWVGSAIHRSQTEDRIRAAKVKTFDEVYDMFRKMDSQNWFNNSDKKDAS